MCCLVSSIYVHFYVESFNRAVKFYNSYILQKPVKRETEEEARNAVITILKKRKLIHRKGTLERKRQREICPEGWTLVGDDYVERRKKLRLKREANRKEKIALEYTRAKLVELSKKRLKCGKCSSTKTESPRPSPRLTPRKAPKRLQKSPKTAKKRSFSKSPQSPTKRASNSPVKSPSKEARIVENLYEKSYKTKASRLTLTSKGRSGGRRTPPVTRSNRARLILRSPRSPRRNLSTKCPPKSPKAKSPKSPKSPKSKKKD